MLRWENKENHNAWDFKVYPLEADSVVSYWHFRQTSLGFETLQMNENASFPSHSTVQLQTDTNSERQTIYALSNFLHLNVSSETFDTASASKPREFPTTQSLNFPSHIDEINPQIRISCTPSISDSFLSFQAQIEHL